MGDFTSVLSGLACRDSLYSEHSLLPSLSLFVRGFASHLTFFLSFLFFFFFQVSPRTRGGENEQGRIG